MWFVSPHDFCFQPSAGGGWGGSVLVGFVLLLPPAAVLLSQILAHLQQSPPPPFRSAVRMGPLPRAPPPSLNSLWFHPFCLALLKQGEDGGGAFGAAAAAGRRSGAMSLRTQSTARAVVAGRSAAQLMGCGAAAAPGEQQWWLRAIGAGRGWHLCTNTDFPMSCK